jgi:bacteriorhodopsin
VIVRRVDLERWAFGFRAVYVLFILWASATTVANAHETDHATVQLELLGLVEIAGALLFLIRRTQLAGLVLLLAVFAAATIMATLSGEMPLRFVYYATSAVFILLVDRHLAAEPTGAPQ